MSFELEDVLRGARSIRPHLPDLIGSEAAQVDQEVVELLVQATHDDSAHEQLLALLKSREPTRSWIAEFLSQTPEFKGYRRPIGRSSAQQTQKYVCPEKNDFNWKRRGTEPIIQCPNCNVLLVPDVRAGDEA